MRWFNRKDRKLLGIGLFLVIWPIPIYGLTLFFDRMNAEGGVYKLLGFLAVYIGPGSIIFGLIIFGLYLVSEVFLLPWRLHQCRTNGCNKSAND